MDTQLVLITALSVTIASIAAAIAVTAARTDTEADRRRVLAVLLQIALMGWVALLALLAPTR